MVDAIWLVLCDLWHLASTLCLFMVVGCLVAPITFGWYHFDKCKEERNVD